MRRGGRLVLATLMLAVAHTGANAEIGRVLIDDTLKELHEATWCAPCIAEMPALEALQDRYLDSGLTVVNLSDEYGDTIRDWLSENPTRMVHGRMGGFGFLLGDPPPEGVDRSLGARPVYVVVDREGTVQRINVGFVKITGPEGESEHYAAKWLRPYFQ